MNLRGIFPPMATPFDAAGALDRNLLRSTARALMRTRLAGIVVLGSNGEAAYVDDDEAETIVAVTREEVPAGRVLVAGTGRDATRGTVNACRRAADAGADAVLVRPPTVFKAQMSAEALYRHYVTVADACPVPVLLYDFAAAFGVGLPIDVIARLAEHANIIGLKESSGDLTQIAEQIEATPDEFIVVVGSAPTLYPSLAIGADGGIVAAANVIPELLVELFECVRRGDHAAALGLQGAVSPLCRAVTTRWGVPALKAAMTLGGYGGGLPRAPLEPAPAPVVEALRAMLEALQKLEVRS